MLMVENLKNLNFELHAHWPTATIRPKSKNFGIGHDGILSIGNFILMNKTIFNFKYFTKAAQH
jgi:hypothetical protein